MKFTLSWLKIHLETQASPQELADAMTRLGLEVESVEEEALKFRHIVIARIIEAKPHPKSSKLQLCTVSMGEDAPLQIVCGAPNARRGLVSVLAKVGATIPGKGGMVIGKAKLGGEDSHGMLCSASELGLGEDSDGIIELADDAPLGKNYADFRGWNDALFTIKITPNRADALGVRGIARDLAAADYGTQKPMPTSWQITPSLSQTSHPPEPSQPSKDSFDSPIVWQIDHAKEGPNAGACLYVVGRYFRKVKNGPSPQWLQDRLLSIGLRPISTLVDITNLLTFGLCRPLHVFDAKRLEGKSLLMRTARDGETLHALNGETYQLQPDMTVIADGAGPVSIAGVMGGMASGCQYDTTDVFLEVALFDPIAVAKAGRKLNLQSDARYRFERGLDPQSAVWGLEIATNMILELCGGEASRPTSAGSIPTPPPPIIFPLAKLSSLGGLELEVSSVSTILIKLGFSVKEASPSNQASPTLIVTPPSWRADVTSVPCLVEEVLRVHGYHHVKAQSLIRTTALPEPALNLAQRRRSQLVRSLANRGMQEVVTWSFTDGRYAHLFGKEAGFIKIANPISSELDCLRPTLIPNLLAALARNAAKGFGDCALFEVGPAFHGRLPAEQSCQLAGLRCGVKQGMRHWQWNDQANDLYAAKADAWAALQSLGAPWQNLGTSRNVPAWYHPGRAGAIQLGATILGYFGEIHPKILKEFDIRQKTVGFEIFIERIPATKTDDGLPKPLKLALLQPVVRDFAFLIDRSQPSEKLLQAVARSDSQLIANVQLFDIYEGAELGDQRSLALAVTLQPQEKTLTDEDLQAVTAKIIAAATKACGAVLRQG